MYVTVIHTAKTRQPVAVIEVPSGFDVDTAVLIWAKSQGYLKVPVDLRYTYSMEIRSFGNIVKGIMPISELENLKKEAVGK